MSNTETASDAGAVPALYWAVAHLLVPQTFEERAPSIDQPLDKLEANVHEEAHRRLAAAREQYQADNKPPPR